MRVLRLAVAGAAVAAALVPASASACQWEIFWERHDTQFGYVIVPTPRCVAP